MVIETIDAGGAQRLALHPTNGLARGPLHVWRTRDGDAFATLSDLPYQDSGWELTVEPDCVYSLTTTTGQSKGSTRPPAARPLGLPYEERFQSGPLGGSPSGFMDQGGAFEMVVSDDGGGRILQQQIQQRGIEWYYPQTQAFTITGDAEWTDYEVSVRARLPVNGEIALLGRIGKTPPPPAAPNAYSLVLLRTADGGPDRFELRGPTTVLASGSVGTLGSDWHTLRLRFQGSQIRATLDLQVLAEVMDLNLRAGRVGVGSGWHTAEYALLAVHRLPRGRENLAARATVTASSFWSDDYIPEMAIDEDAVSRWNSAQSVGREEWLELDFGTEIRCNRIDLAQYGERIRRYFFEKWDGTGWVVIRAGERLGRREILVFPEITTSRLRLRVTAMTDAISIEELAVYSDQPPEARVRISEWQLQNRTGIADPLDGVRKPWFELWNPGAVPVNLSGYHLSDTSTQPRRATVPEGTVLAPGERRLVWCGDARAEGPGSGDLHVGFIPNEQTSLGLYSPAGSPLEVIDMDFQAPDQSSGIPDQFSDAIQRFDRPTPGTANTPLSAVSVHRETGTGTLRLEFQGNPFTNYRVESADGLGAAGWELFARRESDANGRFEVLVTRGGTGHRFFRCVAP